MRTFNFLLLFIFFGIFINNTSAQWFWQYPAPTGNHLFGTSFTDSNNGTIVGTNGTILRTTDGGKIMDKPEERNN